MQSSDFRQYFYGPADIPTTDIEHFRQGYHFETYSNKPGIVLVGQDERAGEVPLSALAQAALLYEGFASPVTSTNPADFFEMEDSDGKPLKIGMYAVQAFIADETKRIAVERLQKMTHEHVMGDARMRLLAGEFTWEKVPS